MEPHAVYLYVFDTKRSQEPEVQSQFVLEYLFVIPVSDAIDNRSWDGRNGLDMEIKQPSEVDFRMSLFMSAACILLFIILFASSAAKPLHLDSIDFAAAAQQTGRSGVPIYYRGEEAPKHSGLYHPPLYIYLLAAWIRVFGSGESQVQLFGMLSALLQGGVVLAIMETLFGSAFAFRWSPFFWAIFLLNPYTLQTASIADIDSTIYGPLLCLVLLAVLRLSWRGGVWRVDRVYPIEYAFIGACLFLCLWAKLTTVLLVFPALFCLLFPRFSILRAALITMVLAAGSIVAFLVSYYLYGAVAGVDVTYTYRFLWESFSQRGSNGASRGMDRFRAHWDDLRFMVPFMISWTGLLPWVAACITLFVTLRATLQRRDWRLWHYATILGLATLSTVYYCAQQMTFGAAPFKYVFVYWAAVLTSPLFLLSHWMSESQLLQSGRKWPAMLLLPYVAAAVWAVFRVRDSLMLDGFGGPYIWVAYIPALTFLLAFGARNVRHGYIAAAASLVVYSGLQFGIALYQESTPYSTTYDYGQMGFTDTAAFLRSNTGPDDVIAAMKDIGFHCGRRYFETYGLIYINAGAAEFKRAALSNHFAYLVFTEGRGQDQLIVNPSLRQWVLDQATLVRSFGNYRVYQINSK